MSDLVPKYLSAPPLENNRFDTFDLDGDGIRQLSDFDEVTEVDDTQCSIDLAACNANTATLQDELDAINDLITPPIDDENVDGSGSWSRTVVSQYNSGGPPPRIWNDIGPGAMNTTLSLWYDPNSSQFKFRRVGSNVTAPTFTTWLSQVVWRVRLPDFTILFTAGVTEGSDATGTFVKASMPDGLYYVEAQRFQVRYYNVDGGFDEGFASVGQFTVTGTGISTQTYTAEVETDTDGNPI